MLGAATTPPCPPADWGFFAHRRLNRLAVFTLDPEMMPFFRGHLEWLTDHAVDPDKRRYASPHEAVRHYVDLDHWRTATPGYAHVPRRWTDALLWRGELVHATAARDTQTWFVDTIRQADPDYPFAPDSRVRLRRKNSPDTLGLSLGDYRTFWINNVLPHFYEDRIVLRADSLHLLGLPLAAGEDPGEWSVREKFSEYGILPYHLEQMHRRLTAAFMAEDADRILRLSAEMGHYLGDAHVPLHTTENYNGQLTGQLGIHAFWESRLPELFADDNYDYFVGKAEYLENPRDHYWQVVLDSHALVDSVLRTERRLRATYPTDQQMCYDERGGRTVRTQCAEFAAAWDREMQGMVEERFRAAIRTIGSAWFTCWVDAGQPDLRRLAPGTALLAAPDTLRPTGRVAGRPHE